MCFERALVTYNLWNVLLKYTVFKYLGVKLDDSLSYSEHVRYVATKVSQKLGLMSRIRHLLTSDSVNRLYKAMIKKTP